MLEISISILLVLIISALLFVWMSQMARRRGEIQPSRTRNFGILCLSSLLSILLVGFAIRELSSARTWQSYGTIVHRVPTSEPAVALTFDDGPKEQASKEILKVLNQLDVRATFFVTGDALNADLESGQRLVRHGHELGNHSYSHQRMIGRSAEFVRYEIEETDRLIRESGYEGPILFRPPYFKKLITLPRFLQENQRTTVTADIEPEYDAKNPQSVDSMVEYVIEHAQPGSIILLHVMFGERERSLAAVPRIVQGLRRRGIRFVTVGELLEYAER